MKSLFVSTACSLSLLLAPLSCVSTNESQSSEVTESSATRAFQNFQDKFLDRLWQLNPEWAIYEGYYKYMDQVTIPNAQHRQKYLDFCRAMSAELQKIDFRKLDIHQQTDYQLIANFLERSVWNIEALKAYQWNPSSYNISSPIARLFEAHSLSEEERYLAASARFAQASAYYAAARQSIQNPTLEHTQLAILQHQNLQKYWQDAYRQGVRKTKLSSEKQQEFIRNLDQAIAAVNQHLDWLRNLEQSLQKSGNARSFRLGKDLYAQKFKYDLTSSFSADQLYGKALAAKETALAEMDRLSHKLWSKYFPDRKLPEQRLQRLQTLVDRLSEEHPRADQFRQAISKQIPELEAFVKKHNLVDVDPKQPLVVRDTPVYARGVAGASINAPGPYDKAGETFYNVTPLDGYTDEEAKSYLREYNHYTLQILNIHEAIPGHYTQLVYSNRSPSLIKSLFGNGTMIEGWAVYTERMMLEEGYGDHSPELWFMYYKWHLRVILNAILDYEVHNKNLSEADAVAMLMNEGFQERTEAEQKWRRATLSQVQLASYFTGYTEIYELRNKWRAEQGSKYNLRQFHDKFLSYGSAPVPYIRQLMLSQSH